LVSISAPTVGEGKGKQQYQNIIILFHLPQQLICSTNAWHMEGVPRAESDGEITNS